MAEKLATSAAPDTAPAPALLQVQDLCVGYDKSEIVHDVSFDVRRGEFVCIIGANGCGKTTMLKSILGLLKPTSGTVTIDGKDSVAMNDDQRARYFAYIPQLHTPPFPFCVADVVLMGRTPYAGRFSSMSDHDLVIAYEAMERMGIADLAHVEYTSLSGGQQQLVLIARALAQEPLVLIMDEPTASLDFGNQQTVLSQMKKLTAGGTTVVMVTHDPDHALYCATRVIAMHEGTILSNSTPAEVMTDECLHKIYETDARILDVDLGSGEMARVCIPVFNDEED